MGKRGDVRPHHTTHNHQCAPQTNSRSFLEFSFEHFQTAADESLKPDKVKRGVLLTLTRPRPKEGARCLCSPGPLLLNVFKTTMCTRGGQRTTWGKSVLSTTWVQGTNWPVIGPGSYRLYPPGRLARPPLLLSRKCTTNPLGECCWYCLNSTILLTHHKISDETT